MTLLGRDAAAGREVRLPQHPRPHMAIAGDTGQGKSALLENLIDASVRDGRRHSVAVFDPHGPLVRAVLANIPPEREEDVVYLELTDRQPFGANLFACEDPTNITEVAQVSSFVLHLLELVWGTGLQSAPVMAMVVRHLTYTCMAHGLTLAEAPLLLTDEAVRRRLTANLHDPQAKRFWQEYERMSPRQRADLTSSTLNKLDALLSPLLAPILSQHTSLPWRRLMAEGTILLVHLSPLVDEASRLIGALILGQLLLSSLSRITDTTTTAEKPRECHVFIDEAHRFATRDLATWMHEARKASVVLHTVFQSLSPFDPVNRAALLSAGALVVFRVSGGDDPKTFAASFDHRPPREEAGVEPVRSATVDPVGFLTRHGHPDPVLRSFTEYLLALEAVLQKLGTTEEAFAFGCTLLTRHHFIEGRQALNAALSLAQQTGRADGFVDPLALLTLGACVDASISYVFYDSIRSGPFFGWVCQRLDARANRYGRADFLANQAAVATLLNPPAKKWWWPFESVRKKRMRSGGPAFVRMLRSLRKVMQILAKEPILTDTGVYAPRLQQRSFSDMENQIANEISQLERFTCRVKLLSSEHTVKTRPAPQGLTGDLLAARLSRIKRRMFRLGYVRDAQAVREEVAKRHEQLRGSAGTDDPPPAHG
jgi:uncharacterized protein DUF87